MKIPPVKMLIAYGVLATVILGLLGITFVMWFQSVGWWALPIVLGFCLGWQLFCWSVKTVVESKVPKKGEP